MIETVFYSAPLHADQMAALRQQYKNLIEKAEELKTELREVNGATKEIMRSILSGRAESTEMKLRLEYNQPIPGKVEIYDADTGEFFETRDMTEEEKSDMFVQAETAENKKADEQPRDLIAKIASVVEGKYRASIVDPKNPTDVWYQYFDSYEEAVGSLYVAVNGTTDRWTWCDEVEHTNNSKEALALCEDRKAKAKKPAKATRK